ncbi:SulP family inorganic anion transporter [Allorhodopirellula heiligendammensis]|uniref:C4-dicarboxylic acid transporter DauA n=1 Tax=Allorhodopirellula heiligendammensis TaxID=2714739 RepID=A0A5C6BVC9_9BACT|nr:SulP family inorganic anion transporter [Allorhodopirellula heiligendammensis]TWU15391.1 C4-dicarboxylic acid transporter DauA [Allorhodopirellula heiligendammensis]
MLNFFRHQSNSFKNDLLSGITVALALVPEAIAFAFVAGVSPLIGLYSAFFIGLITAVVGGRPGMISGATGAMAVVVVALVHENGVEYLFPAVILCGLLQVAVGIGRLGKLIRMVPHSVMLGFVNGLAIVIGMAQLGSFKTLSDSGNLVYLTGTPLVIMLVMVVLTMAIIYLLPKLTTAVPASLAAILTVTFLSVAVNQSMSTSSGQNMLATVGDMLKTNTQAAIIQERREDVASYHGTAQGQLDTNAYAHVDSLTLVSAKAAPIGEAMQSGVDRLTPPAAARPDGALPEVETGISGGLPVPFFMGEYDLAPLNFETLKIIFPYAIVLCGVGLIESLMTLTLIDEITETRGQGNRECIGQGVANLVCGFFGGMGGCAMIGQSLINVNSGGRGRLSGITAAVCLLAFVLFFARWIEQIPMAALVGVMFMVVIGTFEWASLKMFRRMPRSDMFVMVLVAGYTVIMHDLASAVIIGVIVSALVFAWQHATHIAADEKFNEFGSKIYQLHGPLFFASVSSFKDMFNVAEDPEDVVIDFYYTRVYDQSAIEAINTVSEKYLAAGKRLHLTHLSEECRKLLDKAGDLVEINVSEDPHYHIATDRLG